MDITNPTAMPLPSGQYFDYLHPQDSFFTIETVAHSLSLQCRFNGLCKRFYSVAQHSVHCCDLAQDSYKLEALLHDAPEFVMGDVVKPLKVALPDYARIEANVERVVLGRFGLCLPLHQGVKQVDEIMLATEQMQLTDNRDKWIYTNGREPANFTIPVWTPEFAKTAFLSRYDDLTGRSR